MTPHATPQVLSAPPSPPVPPATRRLERLSVQECLRLLGKGGYGRIAFCHGPAPVILPVNFALDRGSVVLRTAEGTMIHDLMDGDGVAFQVDEADLLYREGWSVLVRGRIEAVTGDEELEHCRELPLGVFAPGVRDQWYRIVPATITGRRVR